MEKKSIKEVLKVLSQPETKKRLKMVVINHHQEQGKETGCDITLQNPVLPYENVILYSANKNDFCNELTSITVNGRIGIYTLTTLFELIGYNPYEQ